jgi:ubiquinone/menaquinone biosynthesis C-methylase UbiE/8-oxo-dGTP pyrophosphatase MutT (NUDIX family)
MSIKIDVVAAIIERQGRFLFGKRSQHKRSAAGYWCPISGRVEPGESQAAAVEREVAEETGLRVRALEKVAECDTHDGSALIHWWLCSPLDDAPARLANDEHSELAWCSIAELKRLSPVFLEDVAILEAAASGAGQQRVAGSYDRWASRYDADANPTRDLAALELRGGLLELRGRRVVEPGCGTGGNTLWLAERAASVVGLDLSEGMLGIARARAAAPHVRLLQHDITAPWPLEDAAADAVVAMLVLEHVEQLAPFFEQAARVLAPGGQLFLCELHPTRQMLGKGARFSSEPGGHVECVSAFPHDVSDYVGGALAANFVVRRLLERRDPGAPFQVPPRVLSALFEKAAP